MAERERRILAFSGPQGHASLAEAVKQAAEEEEGVTVKIVDLMSRQATFWNGYRIIYRSLPSLFGPLFELGGLPAVEAIVDRYIRTEFSQAIEEQLATFKPERVVTTYWGYLPVLGRLKETGSWRWLNIVPDPRGIHRVTVSPRAINAVFDERAATIVERHGVSRKDIVAIGWPLRQEFLREPNKNETKETRKRLGFNENVLTFLACGGSEGSARIKRLMKILIEEDPGIQVIVVAGSNRRLKEWVEEEAKKLSTQMRVRGFVSADEMAKFLSVSDVAFIKAGPNSIFEAVAGGVPVVIFGHISGQEDGNTILVRDDYKLGRVAENMESLRALVEEIIEQGGLEFSPEAEALRARLRQTPEEIREVLGTI